MSAAPSSYLMTYTDEQLAEDIAGCQAAIREVMTPDTLSISDRNASRLDAGRLGFLGDRLRPLQEELARRKRLKPPAPSSTPSAATAVAKAAAKAKSPKSKPVSIDDDLAGPPIIIKDASGRVRTWRPGDGRIHRKRG